VHGQDPSQVRLREGEDLDRGICRPVSFDARGAQQRIESSWTSDSISALRSGSMLLSIWRGGSAPPGAEGPRRWRSSSEDLPND
jgi:hypothetical protein